jgi:hypothetical protein
MKAMRKSRLGLAVGAALGAACLAPATSFGWSVNADPTGTGNIDTNSAGDILLFPIYTTANAGTADTPAPASTSFSVTNTSAKETVVAKIRFREQAHSMDVLDFLVVLSPNDKFDFYVDQKNGAARPTMHWTDASCVVGPSTSGTQEFPTPSDFVETDEQMSVGHLEVLGMADLSKVCVTPSGEASKSCGSPNISLADAAKHGSDGEPANCGILVTTLADPDNVYTLNSTSSLGDVGNVLIGRYLIDNGIELADGFHIGIEGGNDAIGIKNSDVTLASNGYIRITSQSSTPCDDSKNCSSYYAWDTLDWDHPNLSEMDGLAQFQTGLTADNVGGDWSNNPPNDVGVDWMLSFPDKYAYLDYIPESDCDGSSGSTKAWCLMYSTGTGNGTNGVWTTSPSDDYLGTLDLCLGTSKVTIYDTEERNASSTVSVSPGAFTQFKVCDELNVFTVAASGETPKPSVIQTQDRRQIITFENLDAVRGWGLVDLPWHGPGDPPAGDAVTGLIFTTRATSSPTDQNGSLTDLQKNVGDDYAVDPAD